MSYDTYYNYPTVYLKINEKTVYKLAKKICCLVSKSVECICLFIEIFIWKVWPYNEKNVIKYRRERAKETLQEAQIMLDNKKLIAAVNRIYYAVFYEV